MMSSIITNELLINECVNSVSSMDKEPRKAYADWLLNKLAKKDANDVPIAVT